MKKAKGNKKRNRLKVIGFTLLVLPFVLGLFSPFLMYPLSEILALLLFQPTALSLLFLFMPENADTSPAMAEPAPAEEGQKEPSTSRKGRLRPAFGRLLARIDRGLGRAEQFCREKRVAVALALSALLLLGTNFYFWLQCRGFLVCAGTILDTALFAAVFVLLLGLDIWCKYAGKDVPENRPRDRAVLGNLQNTIKTGKLLFLAAAAVSLVNLLGFFDLHRIFFYVLFVLFIIQTSSLVFLLCLRFLGRELETAPDLRLRIMGRKKGEPGLMDVLEKNAGISMRSLWSLSFLKKLLPYALIFCLAALWLSTGLVQISSNQSGALYRLGKLKAETLEPGLHLTLPWPFDAVDVYDTKTLKELTIGYDSGDNASDNLWTKYHGENENKLLLGGGNELVSINLRIEYKISDLTRYLKCSNSPDELLRSAAYEAVTAKTIGTDLETLLTADRVAFSRSFEDELTKAIAPCDTGLEVVGVILESIHPPVEVAEIYQKIISAGIEADKLVLDAQAQAAISLEEARTSYDTDVNLAEAGRAGRVAEAKASVAEFMAGAEADGAYGKKYRYYKYLDALKKAYSNAQIVIVGDGVDSSNIYIGSLT